MRASLRERARVFRLELETISDLLKQTANLLVSMMGAMSCVSMDRVPVRPSSS